MRVGVMELIGGISDEEISQTGVPPSFPFACFPLVYRPDINPTVSSFPQEAEVSRLEDAVDVLRPVPLQNSTSSVLEGVIPDFGVTEVLVQDGGVVSPMRRALRPLDSRKRLQRIKHCSH